MMYDPTWLADPANAERFNLRVDTALSTRRPMATIQKQLQCIAKYDARKRLVNVPTSTRVLIIHGERDRAVFFSELPHLRKALAHAEVEPLPDKVKQMGHFWCAG